MKVSLNGVDDFSFHLTLSLTQTQGATMNLRKARSVYLFGSGVSFVLSVSLWFMGYKEEGIFVGVWVPSILSLGNLILSTSKE